MNGSITHINNFHGEEVQALRYTQLAKPVWVLSGNAGILDYCLLIGFPYRSSWSGRGGTKRNSALFQELSFR